MNVTTLAVRMFYVIKAQVRAESESIISDRRQENDSFTSSAFERNLHFIAN